MDQPVVLYCILDCSASMVAWKKLQVAYENIALLLNQSQLRSVLIPPSTEVELWYWSNQVSTYPPKSYDKASIPALYEWLKNAVDITENEVLRVLLLSDGCGEFKVDAALQALLFSKVRMSVIGVGPDRNTAQLLPLSSCKVVYSLAELNLALEEVLEAQVTSQASIEDDIAALLPPPFEEQSGELGEDEDEW